MSRKEAAAEIEAGGRRKEIADDRTVSTEKSRPFLFFFYERKSLHPYDEGVFLCKFVSLFKMIGWDYNEGNKWMEMDGNVWKCMKLR